MQHVAPVSSVPNKEVGRGGRGAGGALVEGADERIDVGADGGADDDAADAGRRSLNAAVALSSEPKPVTCSC